MAPFALLTTEQARARELLLDLAVVSRQRGLDDLAHDLEMGATDGIPQDMAEDIVNAWVLVPVLDDLEGKAWAVACCRKTGDRHGTWRYSETPAEAP